MYPTSDSIANHQAYSDVGTGLWLLQRLEHDRYHANCLFPIAPLDSIDREIRALDLQGRSIYQDMVDYSQLSEGNSFHRCV